MIEPDDFGEQRTANHMPTIALSIAAVLLLVVGAMSYRESVRSGLEKQYEEKEARLLQRHGIAVPAPAEQVPAANANPAGQAASQPLPAGTVLYDAQGNPVYVTGAAESTYAQNVGAQTEASLPAPLDPDVLRMQQSLEQAREQGRLADQRYNQLASGNAPATGDPATAGAATGDAAPSTEITAELPEFLRNAVENPPGGNPEVEARLQRMRSQIVAAPSLAKVTSYDQDWGVVTFNAGSAQGVKVAQRFAVRRGSDILGWIKVDQVDANQAIAVLVTKNRDSDTSLKPDVGDDLIDFELF